MLGMARVACDTLGEVYSACKMLKEAGYTPLAGILHDDRVIYINVKGYMADNFVTFGHRLKSDGLYEHIPYGELESRLHPEEQFNDADFLGMLGGE